MTSQLIDRIGAAVESQYLFERELGRGGAAVVFLALDRKHDRRVAVKLLLPEIAASLGKERFLREIQLAARLAHPHILPVLDSGTADGLPYYVMPFVEGDTLRDLMAKQGRLPIDVAVEIVRETADALEYAHAAGIVHRDVKPENILLLGGHAVLADFGIARAIHEAADQRVTGLGFAVGTPAYMSPEQAAGDTNVDGRADQYALGAVLFEMLTGQPPFKADTAQATIARRFIGPPPRIRDLAAELPEHIDDVVARALAVTPGERFDGMLHFATALRRAADGVAMPTTALMPATQAAVAAPDERPSIAVLPFGNGSNDPDMDFFSEGVTDEIIGALSGIRGLRVAARSSSYAFRGSQADVRAVADKLGVASVLEGNVRRAKDRVRVRAHLVDARSGFQLWSEQYDRELDDVFAIQDDIAAKIVETLEVQLLGAAARPITVSATHDTVAHDAYLRGRFSANQRTEEGLRKSIGFFQDAIAADVDYVPAYVGLSESLALLAVYGIRTARDVMPLSRDAALEALRRDPTYAEAHVRLGVVRALFDWDWAGAEDSFRRALALSPRDAPAHQRFALDCLVPRGEFRAAITEIDGACALDPLSPVMQASAGIVSYFAG
ncbi:MAG: protein kinase, partial [Gemmatimonadaceae bacterium]